MTAADDAPPAMDDVPRLVAEGIELYNGGAHWHAHEAWEEAWHALRAAGRAGDAEFVQGLILASAAFENLRRGKPAGYIVQIAKAIARLKRNAGAGERLGVANEDEFRSGLATLAAVAAHAGPPTGMHELTRHPPQLRRTSAGKGTRT